VGSKKKRQQPRPRPADELELMKLRYEHREKLIVPGTIIFCILASALPLWVLQDLIRPLAGKRTVVSVSIVATVSLAASLVVNGIQAVTLRRRKQELQRQRETISDREHRLGLPDGEPDGG
jgi:hypothetical protein